ncbi:hypothetical protein Tco_0571760, partial [Tanacetum coccineum]
GINTVMLEETKPVSEHECLFDQQTSKIDSRSALHPKPETMGKHRVRQCRKLHTEPVHLQYLNGEAVTISNDVPLQYSHLGKCTYVCCHCGAMF